MLPGPSVGRPRAVNDGRWTARSPSGRDTSFPVCRTAAKYTARCSFGARTESTSGGTAPRPLSRWSAATGVSALADLTGSLKLQPKAAPPTAPLSARRLWSTYGGRSHPIPDSTGQDGSYRSQHAVPCSHSTSTAEPLSVVGTSLSCIKSADQRSCLCKYKASDTLGSSCGRLRLRARRKG